MIRKYQYTVLSLLFAVLFVIGSMAVTNDMFRLRETKLLADQGTIKVDSPVREWEGWKDHGGNRNSGEIDVPQNVLSMTQMEDAVRSWNNRTKITLHNQVAGQISMEEAIENGEKWLVAMEMGDIDMASLSVNAQLGVGKREENRGKQLDAYFSFWIVTYSNPSMSATLYLNAVTGNVWGAEFTLYEEAQKKISADSLRLFAELAGLQVSGQDAVAVDSGETKMEVAIEGSRLCAQEQFYIIAIGFEKSYLRMIYQFVIE